MAINGTDWTKIIATVGGALIVALQGVNLSQGVAISGQETRIEKVEVELANKNYDLNQKILELEKKIDVNQEKALEVFPPKIEDINKKLDEMRKEIDGLRR